MLSRITVAITRHSMLYQLLLTQTLAITAYTSTHLYSFHSFKTNSTWYAFQCSSSLVFQTLTWIQGHQRQSTWRGYAVGSICSLYLLYHLGTPAGTYDLCLHVQSSETKWISSHFSNPRAKFSITSLLANGQFAFQRSSSSLDSRSSAYSLARQSRKRIGRRLRKRDYGLHEVCLRILFFAVCFYNQPASGSTYAA